MKSETFPTPKGQETVIRNIKGKWCPECGAGYFGLESDEVMAAMGAFNDQVDAN